MKKNEDKVEAVMKKYFKSRIDEKDFFGETEKKKPAKKSTKKKTQKLPKVTKKDIKIIPA